jgi:hypothetical protein
MAVKGSRSTANFSVEVMIQLGRMKVENVQMMVTPVSDYDVLLSMDDLSRLGAVIDCQKNSIYFADHKVRVTCDGKSRQPRSAMTKPEDIPDIIGQFPKVFVKEVPEELPPARKVMHRITLKDPTKLTKTPTFKAPQALMPKFKAWIDKQMNAGILHRTSVPGGASMFVQAKSDGRIRPLVDLRFRNDNTVADHEQIPNQETILNAVAKGRYRSKIDLSDAYFQTRVHPDDVKYNTIKTPFGGFTSQVMMQGDMNAPATFVRAMADLFHDELGKNIWVYIDDIFIFSDTFEQHIKDVTNACSKLQKAGYYANPKKSKFFAPKLDILGHLIDDDGIHPAPEKIRTILDWTRPQNQKELQRFNGMVNYISQFIPHIATITAPLTELSGSTAEWLWTDLQEAAFLAVKRAAEEHKVLRPIDYNKPDTIWLFTDASPTGTGAWIGQGPTRDAARPAAFHSRKLTPAQSNYPTHQQETLAIVEAMEAFASHLLYREFTVVTDHESLTKLMTQKNLSGRQQRWLTYISRFDFKIVYQPGAKNFLADYLSRIHEGGPGPLDITLKDPTKNSTSLEQPDTDKALHIQTNYASSSDFSVESDSAMSHTETQTSPTLTSSNSINCCRPEYLMTEIETNAVTRSQKRKASSSSAPASSPPINDNRISTGNSWGDERTLPIASEMERQHSEMSWMSCTDDECEIHKSDKEGASYWPKDPKVRKQTKKARKEKDRTSTSNKALEQGQASLPDIPQLDNHLPPFRMNETILDTPPMASPAFGPLYSQAGYDPEAREATNANQFLSTLHSRLMGILAQRIREALKSDALYTRVKETDNKLHYSIHDGLLLAQNTNGYENLYIPVGPLEKGVSLRDFILKTVHEGLGHFGAHKSYSYAACFFWWPQMRQDFILYCRSCDKCQINNEPTTLPYGRSLTLPDPDEAYQSLAIDFAGPFNKSNGYTTIMVIMDRFTSYTHLVPLKDAATSEKTFKKLNSTIFDVHGLPSA